MSQIADQVHSKFKVFTGKLAPDGTLGTLSAEVEDWVKSAKVAPKSIGVEYLEAAAVLILSVGYRDDESAYLVKLSSVRIGKIESIDPPALASVERSMAAASANVKNVICHELYVTAASDLLMVFMAHQAG